MTTPDLLTTVGFKRTKLGIDGRELGYAASRSSLLGIVAIVLLSLASLAILLFWTQYEFHFERRRLQQKLRYEGHHAASKLAKVEMELWTHFKDDIHESQDAEALLKNYNSTYETLNKRMKEVIDSTGKEAGLPVEKGKLLADRLLGILADQKKVQVQAAKHLVDHLIAKGKKSVQQEQHLDKRMDEQMKQESHEMAANPVPDIPPEHDPDEDEDDEKEKGPEADELKRVVTTFFEIFEEFNKWMPINKQPDLTPQSSLYKDVLALQARLMNDEMDPAELEHTFVQEVGARMKTVGLELPTEFPRWANSPMDFVELMLVVHKLPRKELAALSEDFHKSSKDAYLVVAQLRKMESAKTLPTHWLEAAVEKEDDDEDEEEREREKEAGQMKADGSYDYDPEDYEHGEFEKGGSGDNLQV